MFGITRKAQGSELGLFPERTHNDIRVMSINLLLEQDDTPVIWRGPLLAGTVKQFWTDVIWGDLDFLFIDMPPGTGDVPLTVFQSIPLDGVVIVTSPQELVSMIVKKAYNMARQMNIPVLGVVENMSYVKCPDCGKEIKLFGESNLTQTAKDLGIDILGKVPVDPVMAQLADKGEFERFSNDYLSDAAKKIESMFVKAE
jgi:Mrp family chromosome partitioning ATPase